jgi:hypothetical protein
LLALGVHLFQQEVAAEVARAMVMEVQEAQVRVEAAVVQEVQAFMEAEAAVAAAQILHEQLRMQAVQVEAG